jgi:hypothetical protein
VRVSVCVCGQLTERERNACARSCVRVYGKEREVELCLCVFAYVYVCACWIDDNACVYQYARACVCVCTYAWMCVRDSDEEICMCKGNVCVYE